MFLKYFFDCHILDKKVFLNITSLHECKTLLLFCKTFSILEYDELNQISYIQNDHFFVRGPIFNFNDRNQILKASRDVKKHNLKIPVFQNKFVQNKDINIYIRKEPNVLKILMTNI